MAIVYEHIRNDTNEVFYVGIGEEEKRAFNKHHRSPYWKHIVNKVGYSVNIIYKDIDWEDACKIEKLLIEKYGRKDLGLGLLVNMTDGGEGTFGVIVSEESKKKISEANKGNTNMLGKIHSEETRQKISEATKGNTNMLGKTHSEETRQKMSESKKGRIPSEETRQKMSEAKKGNTNMLGKTHSEETRQKLSAAGKGRIHSEETRQKMTLGHRNKKDVKGYSFNKANKKYQVQIRVEGKQTYIGAFNTPEEASQAYQQAKLIYHM
jgi:group I intron endonuclease